MAIWVRGVLLHTNYHANLYLHWGGEGGKLMNVRPCGRETRVGVVTTILARSPLLHSPTQLSLSVSKVTKCNPARERNCTVFTNYNCSMYLGLTQFDLSEKEMDNLLSKRWNFSSSTTKVSSLASSGSKDSVKANENILEVPGSNKGDSQGKETVGQAYRRLSASINVESLKHFKRPDAVMNLGGIPESPLPLDSPFPLDSPLMFSGIPPISEEENDDIKNGGGILIKVPPNVLVSLI